MMQLVHLNFVLDEAVRLVFFSSVFSDADNISHKSGQFVSGFQHRFSCRGSGWVPARSFAWVGHVFNKFGGCGVCCSLLQSAGPDSRSWRRQMVSQPVVSCSQSEDHLDGFCKWRTREPASDVRFRYSLLRNMLIAANNTRGAESEITELDVTTHTRPLYVRVVMIGDK